MVITVFRARMRAGSEARLAELDARMRQLAATMPGFRSYSAYAGEHGEGAAIVEFETMEDNLRWRNHPEHLAVQAEARASLLTSFCVQVCELVRESRYPDSSG